MTRFNNNNNLVWFIKSKAENNNNDSKNDEYSGYINPISLFLLCSKLLKYTSINPSSPISDLRFSNNFGTGFEFSLCK